MKREDILEKHGKRYMVCSKKKNTLNAFKNSYFVGFFETDIAGWKMFNKVIKKFGDGGLEGQIVFAEVKKIVRFSNEKT